MIHSISGMLTFLYKDFLAYTEGELKKLNLRSGQLPFLLYVGKHPGCAPAELKTALRMDWGHCQRTLDKLEAGGFLTKEPNPEKSRSASLHLTETGHQAFETGHRVFREWDQGVSEVLTREEQQTLQQLLETIVLHTEGMSKYEAVSNHPITHHPGKPGTEE